MSDLARKTCKTAARPGEDLANPVLGKTFHRKGLMQDVETGMEVMPVRFPAGTITPSHRHPCGHWLHVLEDALHTQAGTHGTGDFIWDPEANIGERGATGAGPVTLLFVSNKPFGIEYLEGPQT